MTRGRFYARLALAAVASAFVGVVAKQWPEGPRVETLQEAHRMAHCGTGMSIGTGLTALAREPGVQRGWLTSMIPGQTDFRVRGGGKVEIGHQTGATSADLEGGRMVLVTLSGMTAGSVLEWKPYGARNWEPVDRTFLYPSRDSVAQQMVDNAIKNDTFIPGTYMAPSAMKDPRRIVKPEDYESAKQARKTREFFEKLAKTRGTDD